MHCAWRARGCIKCPSLYSSFDGITIVDKVPVTISRDGEKLYGRSFSSFVFIIQTRWFTSGTRLTSVPSSPRTINNLVGGRRWNELVVAPIRRDYLRFISGRVRRVQHGIDNSFDVFNDVEWSVAERTSVPLSRLIFLGMSNQNVATLMSRKKKRWWNIYLRLVYIFVSLLYLSSDRIRSTASFIIDAF